MPDAASGRFRDLTLDAFLARLSSAEPAPGGGSASAVAASLGAALVAMVAALSEGRPRYAEHADLHAAAGGVGRRLVDRFLVLADEDAAAYSAFAAALKLPRDTDAEQEARSVALRAAARVAADVPLACVEACAALVAATEALAGRSNANASSDLGVAALLGEAAARGAAANVLVNLPSVGDEALASDLRTQVETLLATIAARAAATRATVQDGSPRSPLAESDVALLAAAARD